MFAGVRRNAGSFRFDLRLAGDLRILHEVGFHRFEQLLRRGSNRFETDRIQSFLTICGSRTTRLILAAQAIDDGPRRSGGRHDPEPDIHRVAGQRTRFGDRRHVLAGSPCARSPPSRSNAAFPTLK